MQLEISFDGSENAVSLDRIVDMVMDSAEAERQPQFEYMRVYEQRFMEEIKKYSHSIRNPEFNGHSWSRLEEAAERKSLDLHEVMADACVAHLKHGIKLGAGLVMELLH